MQALQTDGVEVEEVRGRQAADLGFEEGAPLVPGLPGAG
jgi:hypothetical protein